MGSHCETQMHGPISAEAAADSFFLANGWTKTPHLVQWMITLDCPMSCPHCLAYDPSQRCGNTMSRHDEETFLDQVADMGVQELLLTGGEPLSRPDFPDILRMLKARHINWSLNTAVCPDPAQKKVIEAWPPSFVAVSLDGPECIHDTFRGRAGAFDEALRSIEFFNPLARNGVAAGTTVTSVNFSRLPQTFGAVVSSGAQEWGLHLVFPEGRAAKRKDLFLSRRQLKKLLRFAAEKRRHFNVNMADEIGFCGPWDPLVREAPFSCGAGRNQCVVLPDGEVMPCSTLDRAASAGNVLRTPLQQIWENGFELLRNRSLPGKCAQCEYASACGGGCWLQRRKGAQCFKDVWSIKRASAAAAVALCVTMASAGEGAENQKPRGRAGIIASQKRDSSNIPEEDLPGNMKPGRVVGIVPSWAAAKFDPKTTGWQDAEPLTTCIVRWYAIEANRGRAGSIESLKALLDERLPKDAGAAYLKKWMDSKREETRGIENILKDIESAFKTECASLTLVGLAWRDVIEWSFNGPEPEKRSPEQAAAYRKAISLLKTTSGNWQEQLTDIQKNAYYSRRAAGGAWRYGGKAGPPTHVRMHRDMLVERGWWPKRYREDKVPYEKLLPYGTSMNMEFKIEDKKSLEGVEISEKGEGRIGPFDIISVPDESDVTVSFDIRDGVLSVVLPAGQQLGYGDVLRLANEQNRETIRDRIEKTSYRYHFGEQNKPLALLGLLKFRRELKAALETTAEKETPRQRYELSRKLRYTDQELIDILLF